MSDNEILRMANQIADFFAAYPEEEAVEGVAQHIRDFWDPRMLQKLAEELTRNDLSPLARRGAEAALGTARAA